MFDAPYPPPTEPEKAEAGKPLAVEPDAADGVIVGVAEETGCTVTTGAAGGVLGLDAGLENPGRLIYFPEDGALEAPVDAGLLLVGNPGRFIIGGYYKPSVHQGLLESEDVFLSGYVL